VRILILAAVCVAALPIAAVAFKEGPYPNVTGGFGEQSCHLCHLDNPVNAPGGRLDVDGPPPAYAPGESYRITISIAREGLRRGGFEIAARFAAGKLKGRQAGTWKPLDDRVQLIPGAADKTLTFVQHTLAGSRAPVPGTNRWTIEWEAPQTPAGPVQFNVAANATNNDDSALGDYIYVKAVRSIPGRSMITGSSSRRMLPFAAAHARAH
jgi:hypothetical protein